MKSGSERIAPPWKTRFGSNATIAAAPSAAPFPMSRRPNAYTSPTPTSSQRELNAAAACGRFSGSGVWRTIQNTAASANGNPGGK